mmetsp:Transcript_2164/g.3029  ORF Transcript_2164/g.3029 Transcript_2164/m.3029 type:complete len:202 (-) Transcript_2164:64-669(-)
MPPRIQIPSHVFAFSLLMTPGVIYGMYYQRNQKDEEYFQEELQKNYSTNITVSKAKRADMVQFVNAVRGGSEEKDNDLNEVLKAGKDSMKRNYAVDKDLYGTTKGMEEKKKIEQQLKEKKQRRRRKEQNEDSSSPEKDDTTTTTSVARGIKSDKKEEEGGKQSSGDNGIASATNTSSVLAVAGVGIAAATIGFLAGGKRSS